MTQAGKRRAGLGCRPADCVYNQSFRLHTRKVCKIFIRRFDPDPRLQQFTQNQAISLTTRTDEKTGRPEIPQKDGVPRFSALEVFDPEQPFCGHRRTSLAAEAG
jgi:hypothetical protein